MNIHALRTSHYDEYVCLLYTIKDNHPWIDKYFILAAYDYVMAVDVGYQLQSIFIYLFY